MESLPAAGRISSGAFRPLNDAIFRACKGKASQCGDLDQPALVAVTTFHGLASMICFNKIHANMLLTGEMMLSWNIDTQTGEQVGDLYGRTELRSATFLKREINNGIGFARSSISGLLLCGLAIDPPRILGVLHPNPVRPFDPGLLPDVPFCNVQIDRCTASLSTRWVGGSDE